MILAIYYVAFALYTFLFLQVFNVEFNIQDPMMYVLGVVSVIIGFILAFLTVLLFTEVFGRIRRNTDSKSKINHYFSKSLMRFTSHIVRMKVHVTGYENVPEGNDFVLISNHQDNFDIMVYLPVFKKHQINFIAKESLFKWPVVGQWIGVLGNIPISKFADRQAAEAIINGIKRYKSGNPMAIFPEGKRSLQQEMIEFKPGAFKLAMKPKADILVGTLYDVYKVSKTNPFKKKHVYVHFQPVIKYEDYKHMKSQELSAYIKDIIQKQLDQFKEDLNH